MSRAALATLVASATLFAFACDTQSEEFTHQTSGSVPITEVVVELDSGNVHATGKYDVGGAAVTQVKATAMATWYGERPTVEFVQQGTVLRIEALCGRTDTCEIDLEFDMPPGAILRVDGDRTDVEVESTDALTAIETLQGDLRLTGLGGPLDVSTRQGNVTGTKLRTSKAEIDAFEGDIHVEFTKSIWSVVTDTVHGNIWISVPTVSYFVEAMSGDGKVEVEVPLSNASTRRLIHAVASESGDIWIGPPA